MVNKAILIGNVGQDPEIRYTGEATNGTKVATLRLATTERYRDRNGNLQEHTEWHNIVVWRNTADVVEKYVRKGTQLYIEGRIRTRSWEDQTGAKKYTTEIVADTLQLLGRKSDNPAGQGYGQPQGYGQTQYGGGYQAQAMPQQSQGMQQPYGAQQPYNQGTEQGAAQRPASQPQPMTQPKDIADDMPDDDLPF